jgi:dipeptidyl aminopeptidase/acylaminoacyl peptidase
MVINLDLHCKKSMVNMKKSILIISALVINFVVKAQDTTIPLAENLVIDGIPAISSTIISEVKSYTESRGAGLVSWHPKKKEILISTRFGNSSQLHYVKMPGGDRQQITFFDEPVGGAIYEPINGDYFIFNKDIGGNEFGQLYKFDVSTKKVTLLSDGKRSQNGGVVWNKKQNQIAYTSTSRNGADRDFYIMDPKNPKSNKSIGENKGGGWSIVDWSVNDEQLLVQEGLSVNESRLYTVDINTGAKTRLLPLIDERTTYEGLAYSRDGKGIYLNTNKDSEFNRLAYYEIATKKISIISSTINWDVEAVAYTKDGSKIAFATNENGLSKLYIYSTAEKQIVPVTQLPNCTLGGLEFTENGESLGLTINAYNSSSDVYEYQLGSQKLIRWTESELGGMDISGLNEPVLVKWKSFDAKEISGFLYRASAKHTGKRPVIINIHGGPEGQSRPGFLGRNNYYLNELGISIIFPNVRGSEGYGKTFLDADNGYKREESVKDIGALLDWIATQPDLDKDRVMIVGGSYGGYMTLACSFWYADRIKCASDVVGISNFNTFLKNTEGYRRDLRRVEYGDERDPKMAEFLEKISPTNHVKEIKKPLFIVQGGNDPRVPASEAIQMRDKIKENGGKVWFLMAKDEGHGFKKKNNIDYQFYATIEFIKEYLLK